MEFCLKHHFFVKGLKKSLKENPTEFQNYIKIRPFFKTAANKIKGKCI